MMRFCRLPDSRKSGRYIYIVNSQPFAVLRIFSVSEFDSDKDFEGFQDVDNLDIELNSDEKFIIFLEKFSFRFDSDFLVLTCC
jgi:hypothetical protein